VPAPGEQLKAPAQADLDKIEAETRKRVEDTVVKLLPRPESGNDPFIPVTVTSFQDLAQTPLPAPSIVDTATTWLGANWQTVAMVLVGVFSLMMLRSMMKSSQPVPAPTPETSAAQVAANSNSDSEDSEPATVKMPRRRFGTSGPTLRDELREIVQEDPDAAATVLRAWIGDAA
jgi:flagellar M-ring protein FliF